VFVESKAAGSNRGAIRFVSRNGVLELYIVNAAGTIPDKEDRMRAQLSLSLLRAYAVPASVMPV